MPISEYAIEFLSTRVKVTNALLGAAMLLAWYVVFNLQGIYRSHRLSKFSEELREIGRAAFLASLLLLMIAQVGRWPTITLWTAACVGAIGFVLISAMRVLLRLNLRRLRLRGHNIKTLLIVGGGPRARWFANEVRQRTDLGYRIIGYIDDETDFNGNGVNGLTRLGDLDDLPGLIANDVIDEVFVALPIKSQYTQIETTISLLEEQGIMVHLFTDYFPHRLARSHPSEFEGSPLLSLHSAPPVTWQDRDQADAGRGGCSLLSSAAGPSILRL